MVTCIGRYKIDIDEKNGQEAVHGYKVYVIYDAPGLKGMEGCKCDHTYIRLDETEEEPYIPALHEKCFAERNEKGKIVAFYSCNDVASA